MSSGLRRLLPWRWGGGEAKLGRVAWAAHGWTGQLPCWAVRSRWTEGAGWGQGPPPAVLSQALPVSGGRACAPAGRPSQGLLCVSGHLGMGFVLLPFLRTELELPRQGSLESWGDVGQPQQPPELGEPPVFQASWKPSVVTGLQTRSQLAKAGAASTHNPQASLSPAPPVTGEGAWPRSACPREAWQSPSLSPAPLSWTTASPREWAVGVGGSESQATATHSHPPVSSGTGSRPPESCTGVQFPSVERLSDVHEAHWSPRTREVIPGWLTAPAPTSVLQEWLCVWFGKFCLVLSGISLIL